MEWGRGDRRNRNLEKGMERIESVRYKWKSPKWSGQSQEISKGILRREWDTRGGVRGQGRRSTEVHTHPGVSTSMGSPWRLGAYQLWRTHQRGNPGQQDLADLVEISRGNGGKVV